MKLYIVIVFLSTCFYSTLSIVTCPDKTSGCPDGMTCCLVSDSQYGCCPLENAVCCPDHLHCCPHGNTCDTAQGRCVSGNTGENSRWYRKRPAVQVQHAEEESNEGVESETVVIKKTRQHKPRLPWVNNRKKPQQVQEITCADQRSKCPDHTTCCEMDKGVYGCCPVEDAVCCEDHLHCCPHGTTCDTAEGKCTNSQNGMETPWYKKFPSTQVHRKSAIELKESLIECENGDKCKSAGTCCMDSEDEAYCCPFSNGVCCRGGTHCCPNGFRCVSIEGKCIQEDNEIMVSMAYEPTKESIEFGGTEEKTVCPDKSFCARHETCCESFDEIEQKSVYKCCKLNHATCCEDSCCPRGYHCANGKTCERTAFVRKNFYL